MNEDMRSPADRAAQLMAVRSFMWDGRMHTLREMSRALGFPEQSVSARVRDLRKEKHGSFTVERTMLDPEGRMFGYRLVRGVAPGP